MTYIIARVAVFLVVFTILYKAIPYRNAGSEKPKLALFPKYQKTLTTLKSDAEIQTLLEEQGFKKIDISETSFNYTRGSVFGDFSIKRIKINIGVIRISDTSVKIMMEAGWFMMFDTGDLWIFIDELSRVIDE